MTLIGRRSTIEGIRAWMKNPSRHLILWGATGTGKTHTLTTIGSEEGLEAEFNEDPLRAIENARHPTFFGRGRYAAIEDTDWFTRAMWSKIEKRLSDAPPTVFIALSMQSIPYSIRKNCMIIEISKPSEQHITRCLDAIETDTLTTTEQNPDLDSPLWGEYKCESYRQAIINHQFSIEPNIESSPFVDSKNQPKAILSGTFDGDFSCHPLSILQMANHNSLDGRAIMDAMSLHDQAWRIDGLSKVSRALIARLRAITQNPPPFQKSAYRKR